MKKKLFARLWDDDGTLNALGLEISSDIAVAFAPVFAKIEARKIFSMDVRGIIEQEIGLCLDSNDLAIAFQRED